LRHSLDGVRTLLLSEWDPIGVRDEPAAQDEYDAYAAVIVDMINAGRSETELADYLVSLETDAMGLAADRRRAEAVATKLTALA
jgi:hypothetical protein